MPQPGGLNHVRDGRVAWITDAAAGGVKPLAGHPGGLGADAVETGTDYLNTQITYQVGPQSPGMCGKTIAAAVKRNDN